MDIVRVSVVNGFSCLPSSFPGGRNNHPQTDAEAAGTDIHKVDKLLFTICTFSKTRLFEWEEVLLFGLSLFFLLPEEVSLNRVMCKSCVH